jgi:hypothetical protein
MAVDPNKLNELFLKELDEIKSAAEGGVVSTSYLKQRIFEDSFANKIFPTSLTDVPPAKRIAQAVAAQNYTGPHSEDYPRPRAMMGLTSTGQVIWMTNDVIMVGIDIEGDAFLIDVGDGDDDK